MCSRRRFDTLVDRLRTEAGLTYLSTYVPFSTLCRFDVDLLEAQEHHRGTWREAFVLVLPVFVVGWIALVALAVFTIIDGGLPRPLDPRLLVPLVALACAVWWGRRIRPLRELQRVLLCEGDSVTVEWVLRDHRRRTTVPRSQCSLEFLRISSPKRPQLSAFCLRLKCGEEFFPLAASRRVEDLDDALVKCEYLFGPATRVEMPTAMDFSVALSQERI